MAKSAERVRRRYEESLMVGSCTKRFDNDIQSQVDNYWRGYEPIHYINEAVKEVLMERGVSMAQYIPYVNFARRIQRLCRHYQDKTLLQEVQRTIGIGKEFDRLNREVLKTICVELFNLPIE